MGILDAMEPPKKPKGTPPPSPDTQRTCIDLPGETVRCYFYKSKLQIMLRKHRDVIFEINLGKGAAYTIEADQADFYNARDKKLVEFRRKQKVTFKDGERMHMWVSREFKGHLLLKSNGKLLARYEPNAIDPTRYDADPATKPAPLIVVMGYGDSAPFSTSRSGTAGQCTAANPKGLSAEELMRMPFHEQRLYSMTGETKFIPVGTTQAAGQSPQDMYVVEVKNPDAHDMPESIASFIKHGGEETAVDTTGIMTRNWLFGQIAGAGAYYSDNYKWINELWNQKFRLQKVVHKNVGLRYYIVFKGNPGLRQYITAARYGVLNSKVISISGGAASLKGIRHAAWDATKGSLKKAGALAVIFTIALDTAEWLGDYEQRDLKTGKPKKDFFDLATKIGIDLVKAGVSAALGALAMAAAVALGALTVGIAVVVGAIVVSIAVGVLLDYLDKRTGATERATWATRNAIGYLEKKLPSDYAGYSQAMNADDFVLVGP